MAGRGGNRGKLWRVVRPGCFNSPMRIVFFDLDGTITRHDPLTPYTFGFCLRRPHRLLGFILMLWPVLRFAFDRDRGRLKESLMRATLRGLTRQAIAQWNDRWVARRRYL